MNEWFERHENTIVIILVVFFLLLLILFALLLFLSSYRKYHQASKIKAKKRRSYIFRIDFGNEEVVYFERSNPGNQVDISLDSFYNHIINLHSREMFRSWAENLAYDNRNLLSEIVISLFKGQAVPLFFTVDSINSSKKIIHLSAYSVEYLNENINKRSYLLTPINDSKGIQINSVFTKKSINNGFLLFIRFFTLDKRIEETRKNVMCNELKQVCFLYLKEKRSRHRIEFDDEYAFVIYDTGANNLTEMQRSVMSLIKMLNSRLEMNSYQDTFGFSIGAVETRHFSDGKKCLDIAQSKSMSAERQENKIDWFNLGEKIESTSTEAWEQELDLTLKGKKRDHRLRFLYQPLVYNETTPKLYGYIATCEPGNTAFHSIEEIRIKANEYNRTQELLAIICRSLINKFYNEIVKRFIGTNNESNLRLFIPISSYDRDFIVQILSEVRHARDCHIVIVIDEDDMNDMVAINYQDAIKTLQSIKKKKCELAICFKDSSLTWANSVYEVFDYFIVDKVVVSGKEGLDSNSIVKKLSSKLISFHRPMIALDMESKSMIQIMSNRSFSIFGGSVIENASEDIVELTSRKMSVVKKIEKRF